MRYTWPVEKYLEGELSGDELQKFELEILRNPDAARELERVRNLQRFMENQHAIMKTGDGLIEDFDDIENVLPEHEMAMELEDLKIKKVSSEEKDLENFRTTLAEVEAGRTLKKRYSKKLIIRRTSAWTAAASIALLLIAISILIVSNMGNTDYLAVYNSYFAPEKAPNSERSINSGEENLYEAALGLYNEERFDEAILRFQQIPEPVPNDYCYLYHGITLMELERHEEAIEQFNQIKTDQTLNHYRMWYSGLCYLALEDADNARSVFQDIIAQEGYFMSKSKRILKKV